MAGAVDDRHYLPFGVLCTVSWKPKGGAVHCSRRWRNRALNPPEGFLAAGVLCGLAHPAPACRRQRPTPARDCSPAIFGFQEERVRLLSGIECRHQTHHKRNICSIQQFKVPFRSKRGARKQPWRPTKTRGNPPLSTTYPTLAARAAAMANPTRGRRRTHRRWNGSPRRAQNGLRPETG